MFLCGTEAWLNYLFREVFSIFYTGSEQAPKTYTHGRRINFKALPEDLMILKFKKGGKFLES